VTAQRRRLALITGASSGIGAAFAAAYAARSIDVVLVARRADRLEALAAELAVTHGIVATPLPADLAAPGAAAAVASDLAECGLSPDILVNNAGFSIARTFLGSTWEVQRDFIQVQVMVAAELCRLLMPAMAERRWGRVINIASIVAFSPGAKGHTLYPAAKSFLVKMSRSLAAETAELGIHVTAVCPGQTESEFADANGTRDRIQRSAMLTQSAEAVVEAAIRANEAGREVIVTGLHNKIGVALLKLLPESLSAAIIRPKAAKFALPD
jgi:short-subunit dehydrogenase